jgi:hypothetical protein
MASKPVDAMLFRGFMRPLSFFYASRYAFYASNDAKLKTDLKQVFFTKQKKWQQ